MLKVKESIGLRKIDEGSVTSPAGFTADGVHTGLRYAKKDLGVLISEVPASCAAVYTQSHFQAAPLKITQESIEMDHKLQALIVNSAIANACTGEQGLKDAYEMRALCANSFALKEEHVAVASTGVIGEYLKMDCIRNGVDDISPSKDGSPAFQEAILTTDTVTKKTCYEMTIDGRKVTIGGCAKGSGMIHPNMATMLAFVTTDASIESSVLQQALSELTDVSFNQITVDGETSTNDMVLVMANGLANNEPLTPQHDDWVTFKQGLKLVCEDLAKSIARDGEGATKLIEVTVEGAANDAEARITAKKVVGSSLVKTAVYGSDANWGRIIGAIGHSSAEVNPDKIGIFLGDQCLYHNGQPQNFSEDKAKEVLDKNTVNIHIDLRIGNGEGKAWGCDLTYDYVKINASYRT
ncbi:MULTISPECIES: bifunctional ornithine acetyltransferase/N-acetylglutamate synthase [Metabacillus]|uniref:Bifunctional ornithine acetyltransferase/N-acetylglutamate synthase n=1 Tax=Metabacillus hrfriensis TaxID=3048891 RepID=A0ACD4REM3_9BACI|nr:MULTISPECIES: bifunctional ornithine acetyltransferase/N-acetylglutamate synthase [Metabacillus]UAL53294.1 bifunctional ornithine acetyltransferase/N-acetylglutamate synthase [Metabacillus dongyingensis]UOK58824.1 bifunctional ornithine acetyltransferase/N-acetylglutamate synthase [Bacillus sp. OVS6]USK29614.1 bifunctional ornithine acetyltransferase/N-acetylglutamate synthase [Bacillus sp. CMF21]WHZ58857.1 bifunctional ornithine acetyltransferase/N-acetylglutamate synthase [Metabacillus sp.